MSRPSLPTPCPAGLRRFSIVNTNNVEDDTENIEYTRALQTLQPRRRSMMFSKPASKAPPKRMNNLEDLREEEELCLSRQRPMPEAKKTLLGRPAQRMAIRKQDVSKPDCNSAKQDILCAERRRRSGIYGAQEQDMRRRTIFIPDDTTMLTIHPGANTTQRLDDTFQLGLADLTLDPTGGASAIKQPVRRPRKSLAAAPKRIPLGQVQSNTIGSPYDGPGADTGKENESPERPSGCGGKREAKVPLTESGPRAPRQTTAVRKDVAPRQSIAARQSVLPHQSIGGTVRPMVQAPRPRASINPRMAVPRKSASPPALKLSVVSDSRSAMPDRSQAIPNPRPMHQRAHPVLSRRSPAHPLNAPLRDAISQRRSEMQAAKIDQYPVLTNNLAHPELYEDKWLSHQEVALTHIINEIFCRAGIDTHRLSESHEILRTSMVRLYDHPTVADLHQHLHAGVQFGSLKPSTQCEFSSDVARDIGLRRRFINLFVKNYEESALLAAVEVIVGRQMPRTTRPSADRELKQDENIMDPHASKRALNGFLETFFIDCSDIEHDATDMRRAKKALQRSLMLVWLLDHAKTASIVPGLLFNISAPFKTSLAVLQELGRILLPGTPDMPKVLRLMGFELEQSQHPIDEVVYHVDNLATDLRDGILIAKLITLSLASSYQPACDNLKFPAFGRASKIHNVQLALTALRTANLRAGIVQTEVAPADIVDGHREKTLMLIWHIVSHHGLSQLVDWRELCVDIRRAGGDIDTPTGAFSSADQEVLLQSWATVHAVKHHITITNLTTSFAAAEAYNAILAGFTTTDGDLETRLRAVAFPATWTKHLLSTLCTVPSKITTLSNLAFLASRLLPLARRTLAASVIQRVFRSRRERKVMSQRIALMRIARDCATVVRAQQQIVRAAVALQRAWRNVIARRVARLEKDVGAFQAVARVWLASRSEMQGRVLGGW